MNERAFDRNSGRHHLLSPSFLRWRPGPATNASRLRPAPLPCFPPRPVSLRQGYSMSIPTLSAQANSAAAVHALRHLLGVVGGVEHLPDRDRVAALIAKANNASFRRTLSRCVIACRRDGIWLCREQRALPMPALLRNEMVWDRRFRISPERNSRQEVIVPFGPENAEDCEIDSRVPRGLARAALASRPAVQRGGRAVLIGAPTPILAPFSRFLPSFDLALAKALSELVGAPALAAPPWAGHIVTRA